MAKSPSKFDATTLTNALKQVYYIHKNIVADLNAKCDVLADENEKLQAQKSSAMAGECASCSHMKDMNQRLQETFNALLQDKEAAIKSLSAQLRELSSGKSSKHLDTPESLESSKLLENKVKRREEESLKVQRGRTERNNISDENSTSRNGISDVSNRNNVSDENSKSNNISDENSTSKTHSKLQLLRQGKRSIRYIETQEVPNPKRSKVSPTSNPARLTVPHHSCYTDSVKWAAMLVPETEPTAIEKNHEPEDACEIEELSEHMLVVPETIGLDYTIRNVESDVDQQEGNAVECESNNGHAVAREGTLFSAKNNSKMSGQNAEDRNSHSHQIEESQEPCTQIANSKVTSRDNPTVLETMKAVGVRKPTVELPMVRNQSGTVCAVDFQNDVVKGPMYSNKLDPKRTASYNLSEDNGRSRKKSHAETDVRGSGKAVLASTESKLSDAKKNTEQLRSKPGQTSENLGSNFENPPSPSFPNLASKVSPKEACHSGQRNRTDKLSNVSGDNHQSTDRNCFAETVGPPLGFLGDSRALSTAGKVREFHLDLNGSLNPDVSLSELLASQASEKVVRGNAAHSQTCDEVMNAFDETIAPSSLLQHEEMLRPESASPVKSSQQFTSTLTEDTLKASQDSSPAPNHKRSLVSTSPKNFKTTLKSFVSGGKVDSGKSRSQVTNAQQKTSLYKTSVMDDKHDDSVVVSDDDDDDESIAPSPQGNSQAGSQLHCSIPSSSRSFKFSHQPNKFHARPATTAGKLMTDTTKTSASSLGSVGDSLFVAKKSATNPSSVSVPLLVAKKSATNPSSVSVPLVEAKISATSSRSVSIRLVGDDGESLDLQAALEEIDRSQNFHEENFPQPTTEEMSPQKSSLHVSPVQSFEDSFDRVPKNKVAEFPHVAVVRKKNEREKLEGFSCRECYEYYKNCGLSEEEMKQRMNQCSRHRHKFVAPATPEHFWSLGFPDTAELMERSTLSRMDNETPTPKEKGHRRRRRLEKKF